MATDILGVANQLGGGMLNFLLIIIGLIVWVGIIIGVYFALRRWRRYKEFDVIVWEKVESGGIRQLRDRAGIFIMRKTGNKLFYLKRLKVGLKPDNVCYVLTATGKKVVYLLRLGLKNFVFLSPSLDDVNLNFKVSEEDVNWAINEYEANKRRFSQSLLMQILPFAVMALVCVIILILMIYLFKQFSVFGEVARATQAAAEALRGWNATSVVTSGGSI